MIVSQTGDGLFHRGARGQDWCRRADRLPVVAAARARLIHPATGSPRCSGRARTSDRDELEGIMFLLSTGIGEVELPIELGYGSGRDLLAVGARVGRDQRPR